MMFWWADKTADAPVKRVSESALYSPFQMAAAPLLALVSSRSAEHFQPRRYFLLRGGCEVQYAAS